MKPNRRSDLWKETATDASPWVSVDDRLPDSARVVPVMTRQGAPDAADMAWRDGEEWTWFNLVTMDEAPWPTAWQITHWYPLPPLP